MDESGDTGEDFTSQPSEIKVSGATTIVEPLLGKIRDEPDAHHDVIIDLNAEYPGGVEAAQRRVEDILGQVAKRPASAFHLRPARQGNEEAYLFARLPGTLIHAIVAHDQEAAVRGTRDRSEIPRTAIERVWADMPVRLA